VANGNAPALTGHEILAPSFAVGLSSRRATLFEQLDWKLSTKVISRLIAPKFDFWSNPESGLDSDIRPCRFRASGVTLNKASGAITLNNAALAAATIVSFVLTDGAIAATDVLILNHVSGGTPGSYSLNARCGAGSATIDVRNNTAGSLSEAIVIQFALIKAVNA
jgi:hypothetical protein